MEAFWSKPQYPLTAGSGVCFPGHCMTTDGAVVVFGGITTPHSIPVSIILYNVIHVSLPSFPSLSNVKVYLMWTWIPFAKKYTPLG